MKNIMQNKKYSYNFNLIRQGDTRERERERERVNFAKILFGANLILFKLVFCFLR